MDALNLVFDGVWETAGFSNLFSEVFIYINYSKPANAMNSSLWMVKDEVATANLTINSSCWDYDNSKLILRVGSFNSDPVGFARCIVSEVWIG